MYNFSVDWFTSGIPHLDATLNIIGKTRTDPLRILEIGSYEGRSATWISDNLLDHNDSVLWCIDTFEGGFEHAGDDNLKSLLDTFYSNISQSKNFNKIRVMVNDSKQAMPLMIKNEMKFDYIYIDGSHQTLDVIHDGLNAFNLLADNGAIIFDDYEWNYYGDYMVKKACNVLEIMLPLVPRLCAYQRTYTISK